MFVLTFLFPMNFLVLFGIYSTPKLSKWITLLSLTYEAIQRGPFDLYLSRSIAYFPSLILSKLFLE